MKRFVIFMAALVILSTVQSASAQDGRNPSDTDRVAWGEVVNGLQLGISPPTGTDGVADTVFDGNTLRVHVHLRNVGKSRIRLLATVHGCVAMGDGGAAAILVSKLVLQPPDGGDPLTATYRGWNHLLLLDTRRPESEPWQQTLAKGMRGKADIQLTAEEAEYMSTVLAPGAHARVTRVAFSPGEDSESAWRLEEVSNTVPTGKYEVTAVLNVDQRRSEWKGELKSGPLAVEIRPPDNK